VVEERKAKERRTQRRKERRKESEWRKVGRKRKVEEGR